MSNDLNNNNLIDKYHDTNKVTDTLSYGEKFAFCLTDLQLDNDFNVSQNAIYDINNFMSTIFTRSLNRSNNITAIKTTFVDCNISPSNLKDAFENNTFMLFKDVNA